MKKNEKVILKLLHIRKIWNVFPFRLSEDKNDNVEDIIYPTVFL